ncbi:MAG TPA: 3-isopropylmalate dehydratase small subunit [Polyangiaceae bacterium]
MALEKISKISGTAVHVPGDDLDTDRIIPARFLRCVTFDGLGEHLFRDARTDEDGKPNAHPLNDPRFAGATVMLVNQNFGCGSSREHAPQSIAKAGFRAIVGESFAEIFFGNSTTLGIPCVTVSHEAIVALAKAVEANPKTLVEVNLEANTVSAGSLGFPCTMKPGARDALIAGEWDPIGRLLDGRDAAKSVAADLPYLSF